MLHILSETMAERMQWIPVEPNGINGFSRLRSADGSVEDPAPVLSLFELAEADPTKTYDYFNVDDFTVEYVQDAPSRRGHLSAHVSLLQPCSSIIMEGMIVDTRDGGGAYRLPSREVMNDRFCVLEEEFTLDSELDAENLRLVIVAMWYVGERLQRVMKTAELVEAKSGYSYLHEHPRKKARYEDDPFIIGDKPIEGTPYPFRKPGDPEHIVICFLRYPNDRRDADYMANFGRGAKSYPILGLPGAGECYGPIGATFFKEHSRGSCVIEPESGGAMLVGASGIGTRVKKTAAMEQADLGGGHSYDTQVGDIVFGGDGSSVATYQMTSAWHKGGVVFEEEWLQSHNYDYEMTLELHFTVKGVEDICMVTITSKRTTTAWTRIIHRVKPLQLMWGCLAPDTLVQTPSGPVKIQDIHIGNLILNAETGKPLQVKNTWTGWEIEDMVRITLADPAQYGAESGTVVMTQDHHVMTAQGYRRAGALEDGALVRWNGHMAAVTVERVPGGNVHNLSTDGSPFLAGGFYVGDMDMQNGPV